MLTPTLSLLALLGATTPLPANLQEAAAPETVELRWRGHVGDVLRHRAVVDQEFEIDGSTRPLHYELVLRQEVKEVLPEGGGKVDLTFEAFRVHSAGQLGFAFDSTNPASKAALPPDVVKPIESMLKATVKLTIEPSGHIARFHGLGEARKAAFGKAKSGVGPLTAIKPIFSDDTIARILELSFPEQPVAIGDVWERRQEIRAELVGSLDYVSANHITALETHDALRVARFAFDGTIEASLAEQTRRPTSLEGSEYGGQGTFALDNGYLLESRLHSVLNISMQVRSDTRAMAVRTEQTVTALTPDQPAFE